MHNVYWDTLYNAIIPGRGNWFQANHESDDRELLLCVCVGVCGCVCVWKIWHSAAKFDQLLSLYCGSVNLFDPCRTKKLNWPLTFSSITTKWYVVDRPNYTFFLNRYGKRNLLVWFLTTLKQLLNLTPVQTILWPPGFLYRMWPGSNMKWWSLDPYQHNEIIKPFVSFQLSKLS